MSCRYLAVFPLVGENYVIFNPIDRSGQIVIIQLCCHAEKLVAKSGSVVHRGCFDLFIVL